MNCTFYDIERHKYRIDNIVCVNLLQILSYIFCHYMSHYICQGDRFAIKRRKITCLIDVDVKMTKLLISGKHNIIFYIKNQFFMNSDFTNLRLVLKLFRYSCYINMQVNNIMIIIYIQLQNSLFLGSKTCRNNLLSHLDGMHKTLTYT